MLFRSPNTGGGAGGSGGNAGGVAGGSGIVIIKPSTTQNKLAVFTSTGIFTAQTSTVDLLLIGGGGGAGSGNGGGGGAGGYKSLTGYAVTPGLTYLAVVGAGGAGGGSYPAENYSSSTSGSNSMFGIDMTTLV